MMLKKFHKFKLMISKNDMIGFSIGIIFTLSDNRNDILGYSPFSFLFVRFWKHTIQIQKWGN